MFVNNSTPQHWIVEQQAGSGSVDAFPCLVVGTVNELLLLQWNRLGVFALGERANLFVGHSPIFNVVVGIVPVSDEISALDAKSCLLYTSPSPRDQRGSRMPSSA